jgi:hypothetical protein
MFKKYLMPLFILLVLGLGFWNLKQNNQKSTIPNTKVVRDFKANLTINNGDSTVTFDASQFVGKTALEATQTVTNGQVVTTGTKEKMSVTSINGRVVDSSKREFWELFVNGLSSKQWAGDYKIKEGDQIEWHINLKSE